MAHADDVDVLLAEDSDADVEIILRAFRKAGLTNKVFRVHDGDEALAFLRREGVFAHRDPTIPRLILLDIKMPRLNGIDALQKLRSDDATRSTPVFMLTSSLQEQDMLASYALGVSGYLIKPVQAQAFSQLVTQAGLHGIVLKESVARQPRC